MNISELYALTPNGNGWRILPNGNRVNLGNGVRIGDGVRLGYSVRIGDGVSIGDDVSIGNGVRLGSGVRIGNGVRLGYGVRIGSFVSIGNGVRLGNSVSVSDGVSIGDYTEVLSGFTSLSLTDKWIVHPYAVGKIRCGCLIGTYDELLSRKKADWDGHNYTSEQVKLVKAFARFCKKNEDLMLRSVEKGGETK